MWMDRLWFGCWWSSIVDEHGNGRVKERIELGIEPSGAVITSPPRSLSFHHSILVHNSLPSAGPCFHIRTTPIPRTDLTTQSSIFLPPGISCALPLHPAVTLSRTTRFLGLHAQFILFQAIPILLAQSIHPSPAHAFRLLRTHTWHSRLFT